MAESAPAPAAVAAAVAPVGVGVSDDVRKNFNYALVVQSDMPEEMATECTEVSVTAVEKFSKSMESAAKMIKDNMDKKFGVGWHVIVGEGFGFEFTHEAKHGMYMFFGGYLGILIWKCS